MSAFGIYRYRVVFTCLALILMLSCFKVYADEQTTVKINKPRDSSGYMLSLMKLALEYSDKAYTYAATPEVISKSALREAVKGGELSILWTGASEEMERDYIPIRIDGYRGLMSLRFFIIRNGDQARFDKVKTKEDLSLLTFGQGRKWKDGDILEHAGLVVEKANKKTSLFYMLEGGRFDAFPRGATEAWKEAGKFSHLNLQVEERLIVTYPLPTYFFVHKGYPQLAQDIENGLEEAIADGSFDTFFYQNERVKTFLANANLSQRHVIKLINPFLPKTTPLHRKELWPSVDDLVDGARKHALALGD